MKITNLKINNYGDRELVGYFSLIDNNLITNSWRLLQRKADNQFYILPPIMEFIHKPTNEKRFAKMIDVLDTDYEKKITSYAEAEYKRCFDRYYKEDIKNVDTTK